MISVATWTALSRSALFNPGQTVLKHVSQTHHVLEIRNTPKARAAWCPVRSAGLWPRVFLPQLRGRGRGRGHREDAAAVHMRPEELPTRRNLTVSSRRCGRRLQLCPRGVPARRGGGRCVTASAAAAGGVSDPLTRSYMHAGAHGPLSRCWRMDPRSDYS